VPVKIDHYLNLLRLPRMSVAGVAASALISFLFVKFLNAFQRTQGFRSLKAPKSELLIDECRERVSPALRWFWRTPLKLPLFL
jgi:hypothetical protein